MNQCQVADREKDTSLNCCLSQYDDALLCPIEIRHYCYPVNFRLQEGHSVLSAPMSHLNLAARAYHRILKLARTMADPAGCEEIQSVQLAEALQYRLKYSRQDPFSSKSTSVCMVAPSLDVWIESLHSPLYPRSANNFLFNASGNPTFPQQNMGVGWE